MDLAPDIVAYYDRSREGDRLGVSPQGELERLRTAELLARWLPAAPARVLDVGGGTGVHALPLAAAGYQVDLLDPMPGHLDEARAASARAAAPLASIARGDARALDANAGTYDAVLLLGPLYHLTERAERLAALGEARRVLRPGGVVMAAAISLL
jgi:SAM-dependent methyltransferase